MPSSPFHQPVPIGQAWLRRELELAVPAPAVESFVVHGARRTESHAGRTLEFYPRLYATDDMVAAHLRFALGHEPAVSACWWRPWRTRRPRSTEADSA